MGMTKRLIETHELSERLVEKYQDGGLSEDVTRLLLCALPYQTSMHTTPFFTENADHPSGQASVLVELERAIKVVAHQYSSDATLEDEIVERRMIEPLLEDMNVLSYGARYLHEDPTIADHEQRLTPLFGNEHNQSGTLFDEVGPFVGYLGRNASFRFWRDWYQGFLDGKPLDWELQRRVALIDNDIWKAGPEAVATEIERIEAAYLAEKSPQAERVEFDTDTAKFYTVAQDVDKPDLLGAMMAQVQDALDDVLANPSNGLHDSAREVRVLRRVFTKYGNDPQQIEMGFVSVHKGLTRQILNDELPASEENLALQDALEDGAKGIRATHPDVAENRQILTDQTIRELPEGAKEKLEDALPMLVAISDNDLADDWQNDIPQLVNDATQPLPSGAPPLPGADEATRIFSRAAKIALHLKTAEIVHKIDGSAGYKAARIVATIAALVTIGLAIV